MINSFLQYAEKPLAIYLVFGSKVKSIYLESQTSALFGTTLTLVQHYQKKKKQFFPLKILSHTCLGNNVQSHAHYVRPGFSICPIPFVVQSKVELIILEY